MINTVHRITCEHYLATFSETFNPEDIRTIIRELQYKYLIILSALFLDFTKRPQSIRNRQMTNRVVTKYKTS